MNENDALGQLLVCPQQSGNGEALRVVSDALVEKDELIAEMEVWCEQAHRTLKILHGKISMGVADLPPGDVERIAKIIDNKT